MCAVAGRSGGCRRGLLLVHLLSGLGEIGQRRGQPGVALGIGPEHTAERVADYGGALILRRRLALCTGQTGETARQTAEGAGCRTDSAQENPQQNRADDHRHGVTE